MSDKQKALTALTVVLETSKAALAFLAQLPREYDPTLDGSNLSVIHTDFLSLLSLIYASTTKTSLVLKPSSPSYAAALEPLRELTDRVAALPHCVRLLQANHGMTLAAEAVNTANDVLEGMKSLMLTLIAIGSNGSYSRGEAGDEYMVRTGTVHDIINKARGRDGFSGNNLVAVRKVWKRNQESLDDGANEVHEILAGAEDSVEGESDEDDHFDDGWGELGMPSGVKPSADELKRIKKIYAIVRLSALLHQRIFEDVLPQPSSSNSPSPNTNIVLDEIAQASSDFLCFSDNFISTMYPPQINEHITTELERYQSQLAVFQSKVEPLMPGSAIDGLLEGLQLSDAKRNTDSMKFWKWYRTCIDQIHKGIHELEHELKGPKTPPI